MTKKYRKGQWVEVSYRFDSVYTSGRFKLTRHNDRLGVWVQTDTKDFYPGVKDHWEFINILERDKLEDDALKNWGPPINGGEANFSAVAQLLPGTKAWFKDNND